MDREEIAAAVGATLVCAGVWMRWGLASAGLAVIVLGGATVGLAVFTAWRHKGVR